MPNPAFPILSKRADSKSYNATRVDPTIRQEVEGGYALTRPRYTRMPPTRWTVQYTDMTDADKALLDDFWDQVRGGSVVFDWRDYATRDAPDVADPPGTPPGKKVAVRFVGELKYTYAGVGDYSAWNVTFELESV